MSPGPNSATYYEMKYNNKVRKTDDVAMLLKLIKEATHDIGQKVNEYDKVDEIQRQLLRTAKCQKTIMRHA